MKKTLITLATAAMMGVGFAAVADQDAVMLTDTQMDTVVAGAAPVNPGGFGKARAAYLNGDGINGWGEIARQRAHDGTHKAMNDASKLSTGALPTPGAP